MESPQGRMLSRSNSRVSVEYDFPLVTVIFQIKTETVYGEQVMICGSCQALGKWNPDNAVRLDTSSDIYPYWTQTFLLPLEIPFEYKYIIKDSRGSTRWEPFNHNRRFEPKEQWQFVYDGAFGKKHAHSDMVTPFQFNEMRKAMKLESTKGPVTKFVHKEDLVEEVANLKAILLEKDAELDKMSNQLAVYTGDKLEDLSTENLQELANKCRKTYNRATDIIVKRLEEEKQRLIVANTCGLCLNGKPDTVMIPCGHVHFCYDCAQKMCVRGKCFSCNAMVASIARVYIK